MAFITSTNVPATSITLGERFSTFLERLAAIGEKRYNTSARAAQVARLEAMTDEQLAAKGIDRDMITYHVFRDICHL